MVRSYFGQTTPIVNAPAPGTVVYQNTAVVPSVYLPYSSTRFLRRLESQPGQPYIMATTGEELERAIYKDIPLNGPSAAPPAEGTEPQKIVTLKSGLEVPTELLQRDVERKKAAATEADLLAKTKPSLLLQVGHFASSHPAQATVIALAIGAAIGSIFFDVQH